METKQAQDIVFIDIETIAGPKPDLDSIVPDARLKDPVKIQADKEAKLDKAWRAQALDSIKGQIYCIGLARNDDPVEVIVGIDEAETLEMMDIWLHDLHSPKFIGHNIIDFDALFLFHRGLKYRQKGVVYHFQDSQRMRDTMRIMDGPAWKKMVSQDKMTMLLTGKPGKGKYTGKDVHDLVLNGKGDEVIAYCGDDVKCLRNNYRILNSMGIY